MKYILQELKEDVAIVTINRPEALNALNRDLLNELLVCFESLAKQKVKALILTGTGKAFISGADIKEMAALSKKELQDFSSLGQKVTQTLSEAPFLTVAAVNGYALGGGLEITLSCDWIYMSETVKWGFPELTLGLIPGFGGTQRMTQLLGPIQAKKYILSGLKATAEEALKIGLAHRICSPDSLLDDCLTDIKQILQNSFHSLIQAKKAISIATHSLEKGLEQERNLFVGCFETAYAKEKMEKFLHVK